MSLTVDFSTCDLEDIMRLNLNSTSKFKQIKCTYVHSYCQQDKEYFKLQEVKGLKWVSKLKVLRHHVPQPQPAKDKAAGVSVCVQEVHITIITCSLAVTLGKRNKSFSVSFFHSVVKTTCNSIFPFCTYSFLEDMTDKWLLCKLLCTIWTLIWLKEGAWRKGKRHLDRLSLVQNR